MVSQASSENNTTFAVRNADADLAVKVLDEEFALERAQGDMSDTVAEKDLATVAIVGENMKRTPGIAGKLFGTLGSAGISVIACAQGASETNISFVIKLKYLRKALNSIHDSLFSFPIQSVKPFHSGCRYGRRQPVGTDPYPATETDAAERAETECGRHS